MFMSIMSVVFYVYALCSWVAFEHPGFSGELYVLERGMYSNPEDWGAQNFQISSVQPVLHVRVCSAVKAINEFFTWGV